MATAESPWSIIHAERAALAADLEILSDDQWATPSLCEGWSVRDVLAHMTATATKTPLGFFGGLIANGFSFDKMAAKDVRANSEGAPASTLSRFKAQLSSTTSPPGPKDTWLGETIVHGEDIRRPLGIKREYPVDALVRVANLYKGSNLIMGSKKRIAGLRLAATDTDWSTGEPGGQEVSGPMVSLLLALAGRKQALDDLSGSGVEVLRSRT